jgi:hypothetical protein
MADTTAIVTQLRALLSLTRTEEQIARIRTAQARTDAVRRELQENAGHAAERSAAITAQLRRLAGTGDVLAPVLGRLTALVKSTVEQATPIDEALLGDLQLEHQLLDRATYLGVLGQKAEDAEVQQLAERLVTAHRATVEWLTVVLAEEALGGPAALRATPLQKAAGGASRVVNAPARYAAHTLNRVVDTAQQAGSQTGGTLNSVVDTVVDRATSLTGAVREKVAQQQGDTAVVDAVAGARRELGDVTAAELPVQGWDAMSTAEVSRAVGQLDDPADIETLIRYEETHQGRSDVVSAVQTRLAALAKEAVGLSD